MKHYPVILLLILQVVFVGCQSDEPSILKIYVRSNNFILTEDATVRIVGDLSKGSPEFFEETLTDASGVAYFELNEYFNSFDKKDDPVAYFTVYAKDSSDFYTVGEAKARVNLTSTASITLDE